MTRILATCAAVALTAAFAMPSSVSAAEKRADGARNQDQIEVSAQRKKQRHHVHRHHGPRYGHYRPYRSHHYAPYYAYAPRYYRPYRPYYRPGVSVGVGPFGFGFGF